MPQSTGPKVSSAIARMQAQIDDGQVRAALAIYEQVAPHATEGQWSESSLTNLIKALLDARLWHESVPVMVHYLRTFSHNDVRVRLKLAQVLIREVKRPGQALRVLARIPANALPSDLETIRRKLEQQATKMQDEGELELETEDW